MKESLYLSGINCSYNLCVNNNTFFESIFNKSYEMFKKTNLAPIMHLSCHGDDSGIQLTDGTSIEWAEFREILLPINISLNNGLVVCLSSCLGFNGCKMAMKEDQKLPFFGLIGHTGIPLWKDTAIGFITFYHKLFKGATIETAVNAMKIASGDDGFQYVLGEEAQQRYKEHIRKLRIKAALEMFREYIEKNKK